MSRPLMDGCGQEMVIPNKKKKLEIVSQIRAILIKPLNCSLSREMRTPQRRMEAMTAAEADTPTGTSQDEIHMNSVFFITVAGESIHIPNYKLYPL